MGNGILDEESRGPDGSVSLMDGVRLVAEWLGYENRYVYNRECERNPAEVERRLAAAE